MGEEKRRILVVDDDLLNLKVAKTILEDVYQVDCVSTGEEAIAYLDHTIPDLILLDIYMPGMDGRETIHYIMAKDAWKNIPVICLTADTNPETETECLSIGASDFITKPFVPKVVRTRISRTLELNDLRGSLANRLTQKTKLVEKVTLNSIMAIAHTIDVKDAYTSGHSYRVAKCSVAIAEKLGWKEDEIQNLHYVALLHDIGKIGIPDAILNKPTQLTQEEFSIVKKHPLVGNEILKEIHMIDHVADGALYHHEHYDGTGYPLGLKGEDIPVCARIVCIADAYDAMTSNRVYRSKLRDEDVILEFEKNSGSQFDPKLAEIFVEMLKDGFVIPYGSDINSEILDEYEDNKILNKYLEELAHEIKKNEIRDTLTGLYNRKYAESRIGRLLKTGHSGAMVDILLDDIDVLHEKYGHLEGDRLKKNIASAVLKYISRSDVFCRIGDDEFLLFLCDCIDRDEISLRVNLLMDVMKEQLSMEDYETLVHINMGIAMHPYDGMTYDTLYNNADKALYYIQKAKTSDYSFYSEERKNQYNDMTARDMENIRDMIENKMHEINGAFHVDYEEFKNIYSYIRRCVQRKEQKMQLLLFTLSNNEKSVYRIIPPEAMNALELSVVASLRMIDVGTRYSSVQYMVILSDVDVENAKNVAERVIGKFHKTYLIGDVDISYDIQSINKM